MSGVRILDKKDGVVAHGLPEIIDLVQGSLLNWSILFLDATGDLGQGKSLPLLEEQIYQSSVGLSICWEDLKSLSLKFYQVIDITVIGCNNEDLLKRYVTDEEMYAACDIVIEMIDSSYWEVFAQDESFINKLAGKFTCIERFDSKKKRDLWSLGF